MGPSSGREVRFLFDYASPWAYLADALLEKQLPGLPISYQPVYLRGFEAFAKGIPYVPAKLIYMAKDIQRCTAFHAVAFRPPTVFPINGLHALRGALVARRLGRFEEFHRAAFRAAWAEDRDISNAEVVIALAAELGFDEAEFRPRLGSPEVKDELLRVTQEAVGQGVFGVPSFFAGGELFWGHDRMDYVRRAAEN